MFKKIGVIATLLLANLVFGAWERALDSAEMISAVASPNDIYALASGPTTHVAWRSQRGGGDLRGFDQNGSPRYGIDLATTPYNMSTVTSLTRIAGSTSILVAGGGTVLKVSETGSLIWRVSSVRADVADAFEFPDGSVAFAASGDKQITSPVTLYRVSATGDVVSARSIVAEYGSPPGKFDTAGRYMIHTEQQILSRFDGFTMESTPNWTRIDARVWAIGAARDGGAMVLSDGFLAKISSDGAISWKTVITPFPSPNSGTEYKLVETMSGHWLAYESNGSTNSRVTGVSATGAINFSRIAGQNELFTLASDGSAFVEGASSLVRLDPVTGTTQLVTTLANGNYGRLATTSVDWIAISANSGSGSPAVSEISTAGSQIWEQTNFRLRSPTWAPKPEARSLCFNDTVVATSEGFAAMVVAQTLGYYQSGYADTSSIEYVSASGQRLGSASLPASQCMPAIDGQLTHYVLDATLREIRAVRRDESTAWRTAVSESFFGSLSTRLLGSATVVATLYNSIIGFDKATGAQQWIVYSDPVATAELPGADAFWVLTRFDGLFRVTSAGAFIVADATKRAGNSGSLAMRALRDGGLLLVESDVVTRYNVDGTVSWTASIRGSGQSIGRIRSAIEMANGDVVIGGCDNDYQYGFKAFFARLSSSGSLLHRLTPTVAASSCVDAFAERPTGELVAAFQATGSSMLRLFSFTGVEVARAVGSWVNSPGTSFSAVLNHGSGAVTFGSGQNAITGIPTASLTLVDSVVPLPARLTFISSPPANSRYDLPFSVTLGLVDLSGNQFNATAPLVVSVGRAATSAAFVSTGICTVPAGGDRCTVVGLRGYPEVISVPTRPPLTFTSASLTASATGLPPIDSRAFSTAAAPTTTTVRVLSTPPYVALSEIRYQVDVSTSIAPGVQDFTPAPSNCVVIPNESSIRRIQCTQSIGAPLSSITYSSSGSGPYLASTGSTSVAVQKAPIEIRLSPANPTSVGAGDPFRITANFLLPNGKDVWRWPDFNGATLTRSGAALCANMPVSGNFGDIPTSPHVCRARDTQIGTSPLVITVSESPQVMSAVRTFPLTVFAAYGLKGSIDSSTGSTLPTICGTTPGLRCNVVRDEFLQLSFSCDAPPAWQGSLYVKQSGRRFSGNGQTFGPLSAIEPYISFPYSSDSTACTPDVNGDGKVDIAGDGIFVLKALFGMNQESDYVSLAHACADLSYPQSLSKIQSAKTSLDWDLDGDGRVLPLTDGLLMLRMMLGIYGQALVAGATNPAGLRQDSNQIVDYFYNRCGSIQP